ncbi:hypothetical protein NDU88_003094 [Pleurodeles waltl]|uniref:Uncharacterized protein n=1 Tax=Pleurodeles waltl TaxID=8319 RepID=A0AAV7MA24_PLEWA|nr:hypothetical protein NDU88_003094 [Pleurodeles waltl]
MADATQSATMDRILQEILAVGRKLEGMDNAMASLTAEMKSMCLDIAGFQTQVTGLDQRVTSVETQIASWVDRDQELLYLHSKLINLEDRSCRNNVCFLGFPENIEGVDIYSYLRETLPKLAGITFDPPLEFQRVHRLGPKRRDGTNRPHPIIACLLRHVQIRQLLQLAQAHGPFRSDALKVRLTDNFSRDPRMQEDILVSPTSPLNRRTCKYFWRDFRTRPSPWTWRLRSIQTCWDRSRSAALSTTAPEVVGRTTADSHSRGRDLERLTKSHNDRGQAMHEEVADRDKSFSLLKPTLAPI